MDADTLAACMRAAVAELSARWLPHGLARHVAAHALQGLALGDDVVLVAAFAEALRELPRAGFRQPVPELSDEQIERASRRASVAVEAVLSGALAVEGKSNGSVGADGDRDHAEEVVVIHGDEGAHR